MTLTIGTEQIPLRREPDGTIRIGQTRVTLDCVAYSFEEGATPETIVDPHEESEYLAEGRCQAEEHQRRAEGRLSPIGIRERLLARRTEG